MEENFTFLDNEDKFGVIPNKIAYYYSKVFNIKIISLFCKENKKTKKIENLLNNFEEKQYFNFYILIKDNNKKILKYKLIKCNADILKYRNDLSLGDKTIDLLECLYYFVDKELCDYCKKRYVDNKNNEDIKEILRKNEEINLDYHNWISNKKIKK